MKKLSEDLLSTISTRIKELVSNKQLKTKLEECYKNIIKKEKLKISDHEIYLLFNEILSKNYLPLDITFTLKELLFPSELISPFIEMIETIKSENNFKELAMGYICYDQLIDVEIESLLELKSDIITNSEDIMYILTLVSQNSEGEIQRQNIIASELQLTDFLWNIKMAKKSVENSKISLKSLLK